MSFFCETKTCWFILYTINLLLLNYNVSFKQKKKKKSFSGMPGLPTVVNSFPLHYLVDKFQLQFCCLLVLLLNYFGVCQVMDSKNPLFLYIIQDKEQGFESFNNSILMSTLHSNVNVHQSPPQVEIGQSTSPIAKNQLLREVNEETTSPQMKTLSQCQRGSMLAQMS